MSDGPTPSPSPLPSPGGAKLSSIMSFLGELEKKADDDVASALSSRSRPSTPQRRRKEGAPSPSPATPQAKTSAPSSSVVRGVKERLVTLRTALDESNRKADALQAALQKVKRREASRASAHTAELEAALSTQKAEYEGALKRQLAFANRLLKDKEALAQKCAEVSARAAERDAAAGATAEETRRQHAQEMRKQKEAVLAAEKARRERWEKEQTKRIKELTVRGMEPEIKALMEKAREDLERAAQVAEEERAALRRELEAGHEDAARELRDRMLRERAAAVEAEREEGAERVRKFVGRLEEQMARMREEHAESLRRERAALQAEHAKERERLSAQLEAANSGESERVQKLRRRHDDQMDAARRKAEAALAAAREQQRLEREEWQRHMVGKLNAQLAAKEEALRARCAEERDAEIRTVIERLAREHEDMKQSLERAAREAEAAVQRELQEARRQQNEWMEKYVATSEGERAARADAERAAAALAAALADAEAARAEAQSAASGRGEASRAADEARRLAAELGEARAAAERERNESRAELERQRAALDEVDGRVKAVVAKKDEAIAQLREELAGRAAQVEELARALEQQREELLGEL